MEAPVTVIVGLGNPGVQYDGTRHNIGFAAADLLLSMSEVAPRDLESRAVANVKAALAGNLPTRGWQERRGLLEAKCEIGSWSGYIVKPTTFMNRSGEPLRQFLQFKKISLSTVAVLHDEIDIPVGVLRLKMGGGEGGHNGLRSISDCCGGRDYARIRLGVGKPPPSSPMAGSPDGIARWVLSRFSDEETPYIEELLVRGILATYELVSKGVRAAQNVCNR